MDRSVYFASTLLHLYCASVVAAERSEEAHLIFIDQPENTPFPLLDIVKKWPESPFSSVSLLSSRFKGLINKVIKRKAMFQSLRSTLETLKPKHLFVGNDRRIEFQYSMHICTEIFESEGEKPVGHYLDEGTFTYVGRKASSHIGDAYIDQFFKKLSYGWWWKNPPTIGGSDWIETVHVAFPDLIHPLLSNKIIDPLNKQGFQSKAMVSLSKRIIANQHFDDTQLQTINALITLPHESLFERNPSYETLIKKVVKDKIALGKKVGIKYHPRNSEPDILNLAGLGARLIPAAIPFEAILPLLPDNTEVVGDLSSTLLISRWLRPELTATAYEIQKIDENFKRLYQSIDIKIVPID